MLNKKMVMMFSAGLLATSFAASAVTPGEQGMFVANEVNAAMAAQSLGYTAMQAEANVEKVNINTATAEQLAAALRGVGLARARMIVQLREELGRFTDVEQLLQVRGLGPKVLNDNRDKIAL